jgi:virginiamycin B lyase
MKMSRIVLGCILASFCFLAGSAGAQVITWFSAGNGGQPMDGQPTDITAGPDGNLWFTKHSGNWIGRITPAGVVTEFTAGSGCQQGKYPVPVHPGSITAGPDGNLWFTENVCARVGRMTPQGVVTEFSAGITGLLLDITAGPDGNVWFTEGDRIGQITPAGVVTEFSADALVGRITAGPDGNLWFIESVQSIGAPKVNGIGRITPAGVVTEFSDGITDGASATSITAGPDGNLWFTESVPSSPWPALVGRIGRITPAGVVTEFSDGITGVPLNIAAGPDGNLWFTEGFSYQIGRITPAGVVTEFWTGAFFADGITAGPDGNLWVTDSPDNLIGRIEIDSTGSADLAIGKSDSPDPVVVGSPLTYTITVTNHGPSTANGVTMTDSLLATLTFVSAAASQGSCSGTVTVTCNLGSLSNGSSATVTIVVTPSQPGGISNTATVAANEHDPDTSNNSATQVTTIVKQALPDLTGNWASAAQHCKTVRRAATCSINGSLNIINQGAANAGASVVRFYLSTDAIWSANDLLLGQASVPALPAGQSKLIQMQSALAIGTSASGKFLIAVIDADNAVGEADESNNVLSARLP